MTVRELIEELQELPPDRPVALSLEEPARPGLYDIAVVDVETLWKDGEGDEEVDLIVGLCPADEERETVQ